MNVNEAISLFHYDQKNNLKQRTINSYKYLLRKFETIYAEKAIESIKADVVVNGGDMLPKRGDLFDQDKFITGYLEKHFAQFNSAGISYLCNPGNADNIY